MPEKNTAHLQSKQEQRQKLARDVQHYLSNGGEIKRCTPSCKRRLTMRELEILKGIYQER